MLFVELRFFVFFLAVFGVYWGLRSNRARKLWLLACSYVFYAAWDWRFLSLVLASTGIDFVVGARLGRSGSEDRRRAWLALSVAANLGLLGVFKYYNFFVESGAALLRWLGLSGQRPHAGDRPAGRDQLLHLPDDELHDRRVPSSAAAHEVARGLRALRRLLPAARRRADRSRAPVPSAARGGAALRAGRAGSGGAGLVSSSGSSRRRAWRTRSRSSSTTSSPIRRRTPAPAPGSCSCSSACRSTATSPDTPTWRSAWRGCSATGSRRTSTSRSSPAASPSSGDAGTSASRAGSATTSTCPWGEAALRPRASSSTCTSR